MAKVHLRKYNSEIEALIERGQTDEAVAHCRHILKTFPKHLDTYRLLGKAYLESKRYPDATDIFNRILMAVPDDFVSHVGLSIIADEGKQLDDAIWHMERAFEKQPSNAAIQAELQRLYGRRDGREPPKIRLTRGALAHMYYQGDLYTQAVNEIRSVLSEEPDRTDLQSLLALAHFRAGQKVEASEVCSDLIGRFPYSLDANRVLIEILPGTGMAESANVYRERIVELDPYAAHVRGSIFQTSEAPDAAVSLERLDYKGQPVETGPDWGKSLGIGLGAAAASAAQPEWLKGAFSSESAAPASRPFEETIEEPHAGGFDFAQSRPEPASPTLNFDSSAGDSVPPASDGEPIPAWMREAGWGESSGAFDESSAPTVAEETSEPALEKADLPDWIKSMAPAAPIPSAAPAAEETEEDTMAWLNKLAGDKPFGSEQETLFEESPKAESSAASDQASDWLSGFDKPAEPVAPASSGTSDWLSGLEGPATSAAAAETADWLSKLDEPISQETPPAVEPVSPAASGLDAGIGNLGASVAEQDAAMAWLESLAAKQGAKSEELITNPEDRLEKPPEWVEQAKLAGESQPVAATPVKPEVAPPMEVEVPAAIPEPEFEDVGLNESVAPELTPLDQTGDWLRELDEKISQPEKPVEVEPANWSGEIEIAPTAVEPSAESAPEADLPSWLRGLEGRESPSESGPVAGIPEWLKGEEPEVPAPPEPTRPADWSPEAQKTTPRSAIPEPRPAPRKAVARRPEPKPKPVVEALPDKTKLKRTGMLPPLIDPGLASAREAMSRGKIPDALQGYGNLIRKGKLLEDITFDLKEALYRFPVEVSIWQALGDAYMRANRLQDALDAYTKAEELLR